MCTCVQNIVDVQDGDSLVVLNRRTVARDQDLYDDQRLVMKAMVLGARSPDITSTPRQKLSDDAARTVIYHRCCFFASVVTACLFLVLSADLYVSVCVCVRNCLFMCTWMLNIAASH